MHVSRNCLLLREQKHLQSSSVAEHDRDAIRADETRFNEAVLGRSPSLYREWIVKSQSWGGEVELLIFSERYHCEIVAYDVSRKRTIKFGEESGFKKRIYLIYDGIHYDALVYNLAPQSAARDFDLTVFNPADLTVEKQCNTLVEKEFKAGKFVDEYNYTLQCGTCKKKFKGNNEAIAHSKTTGHTNFEQSA